jgi:ParB/RepB/Spo0J family partition protein
VTESLDIELDRIDVDDKFNARHALHHIPELAESIRAQGLLQPLVVRANPHKGEGYFFLVAGHRRLAACRLLKFKTVRCEVHLYENRDEAMLAALASDTTSDPLRNYDIAERCHYFHSKFGSTPKKLAELIGRSPSEVTMLLACYRELEPSVREAWSKAPDPDKEIPIARLNRWRKEAPSHQKELLEAYQDNDRAVVTNEGEPKRNKKGKRVDGKRPTMREVKLTLEQIEERQKGKHDSDGRTRLSASQLARLEGMSKALRFVLGEVSRVF